MKATSYAKSARSNLRVLNTEESAFVGFIYLNKHETVSPIEFATEGDVLISVVTDIDNKYSEIVKAAKENKCRIIQLGIQDDTFEGDTIIEIDSGNPQIIEAACCLILEVIIFSLKQESG